MKTKKETVGLFTLNLDNQKTTQTRMYISHISSKSIELLERIIHLAVNYVSENYPCDEIRVTIASPANSEGKYESDKTIKQFFDKLGFRWKRLLKDNSNYPMQLLGLACKKNVNSINDDIFKDSLQVLYSCSAQESKDKITDHYFLSVVGIAAVLKDFGECKSSSNKILHNILEKASNNWKPPAFKITHKKDLESVLAKIQKNNLFTEKLEDTETSLALCSVELN